MRETRQVAAGLRGVLAPVVTPFDPRTGELDRRGFERNLQAHANAGLRGVITAGSTGEAPLLEEAERTALVALARATLPADRLVIAGAGAESTRTAVRFAVTAAAEGADAVIVVAPHYYGDAMGSASLLTHYRRVADESPIPVVLYSIPKYMHFALAPAVVAELAAHSNVVGIKDSSGDLDLLSAYLGAQSDDFRVLTGNGASFAQALERGASGGILAVALFAPGLAVEVYESMLRGDRAAGFEAQTRLGPLAAQIVGGLGVPGVKAALDDVGLAGGPPRQPLLPLLPADRERVAALLRTATRTVAA
jgi:4-hydroxy-2-oxoglutarate aldolase